jgi:inosine/xanthosine triphosphatase
MKIIVGSKNPVKINAVKLAFESVWPEEEFIVEGIEVGSGVSEQPMTDQETFAGAKNRALRALDKDDDAEYGVGLEGGLNNFEGEWYTTGWVVIINRKGVIGSGTAVHIKIPKAIMDVLKDSNDLGEAADKVFNRENIKQQEGIFGILTNNALTRTSASKDGVISALTTFVYPELYFPIQNSGDELVDIVDDVNNIQYSTAKQKAHEDGLLHRIVIGAIQTTDGRICLIKQSEDRQDAGQYVCPVGGHVQSGELEEDALIREAVEEIGIKDFKFKLLGRKVFQRNILGRNENHFFIIFQITYDGELNLGDEADDYEYFTKDQLADELIQTPKKFGAAFKFVYENFLI